MSFDLRNARLGRGLTQQQLAQQTKVPVPTIQRLEAGLGAHPGNAKRLADFFKVTVADVAPALFEPERAA